MKLGVYSLFFGSRDKTSRKRNFEFRPLRRAGQITHHERDAFSTAQGIEIIITRGNSIEMFTDAVLFDLDH